MRIVVETTEWRVPTPNHVYVVNDSMTRMIGYVPAGSKKLQRFAAPRPFFAAGRAFEDLASAGGVAKTTHTLIKVEGSKGAVYYVDPDERTCTCPGYQYHGRCKHLNQVDKRTD